ncbi:hypothetical protein T440DRAFT_546537 [Plenodomus tracheiphilus IPT5]|uniref:Uncharacterized protein n=1 Tax=Plenodomus tracheiphilus IPT5 TaxID=1408161 RepID=A0A6A7AS72_9PLEO|nr:hypothetical protein T440DRAFT_546537 [Plenodomus tracheiphilus IPT5]
MSRCAPPDPLCNPPRLLHSDCVIRGPPSLAVFLATCLRRVNVSTLHSLHDATRCCSLCEQHMCDVPEWNSQMPPPMHMNSVMAELACAQNGFATKLQRTAFEDELRTPEQTKQTSSSQQFSHTCEMSYCEYPIQVLTPGCKHYVGHQCLETWIHAGKNRCAQCNTIWYRRSASPEAVLVEAYQFPTQLRYWKDKLRAIYGSNLASTDEET